MTTLDGRNAPVCLACRWLDRDTLATETPACAAYPDGIPDDIFVDGAPHHGPRGDETEGYYFDLEEGRELLYFDWLEAHEPEELE